MDRLVKGVSKVSSGTVESYRSSCGTDFENLEIASPVYCGMGSLVSFVLAWFVHPGLLERRV